MLFCPITLLLGQQYIYQRGKLDLPTWRASIRQEGDEVVSKSNRLVALADHDTQRAIARK
jgi:hypothetical protein